MGKFNVCRFTGKPHNTPGKRCKLCWNDRQRKYMKTKIGIKHRMRNIKKQRGTNGNKSRSKIHQAITLRRMPKANFFMCFDCSERAVVYDHRDYLKPFDVYPVCMFCNYKRGAAKNNRTGKMKKEFDHKIRWRLVGEYRDLARPKAQPGTRNYKTPSAPISKREIP